MEILAILGIMAAVEMNKPPEPHIETWQENNGEVQIVDLSHEITGEPKFEEFEILLEDKPLQVNDTEEMDVHPKILDEDLDFRKMAVQVLGGLSYYTRNCGELTELGKLYKSEIIRTLEVDENFITLDPYYIDGVYAASTHGSCEDLYNVIDSVGGGDMVTQGW